MCRETLRTVGSILTDIAEIKSPHVSPKAIGSKHVIESVQIRIGNLRGGKRKRAKSVTSVTKKTKKTKLAPVLKRNIY